MEKAGSGVKQKTLQELLALYNFVITDWSMRSHLHERRLIVQKLQSANNERTL
jgi:hypothetical protein